MKSFQFLLYFSAFLTFPSATPKQEAISLNLSATCQMNRCTIYMYTQDHWYQSYVLPTPRKTQIFCHFFFLQEKSFKCVDRCGAEMNTSLVFVFLYLYLYSYLYLYLYFYLYLHLYMYFQSDPSVWTDVARSWTSPLCLFLTFGIALIHSDTNSICYIRFIHKNGVVWQPHFYHCVSVIPQRNNQIIIWHL